mgnify:CR=1 FL=1
MIYTLAISLLILVIAYTFQYQIDQLMIRGVPQKLDIDMRHMLLRTTCLLYTSPSPRDRTRSRMPSSA